MMKPSTTNPLKGIRVLELGQFIAGPFAGLQLADMGAQVIKIERPGQGDPFRGFGLGSQAAGYSHNFCAFNRNKLSLTIDLGDARGRDIFRRAASRSDVVLENFRPEVMKRLGLDYESLREDQPAPDLLLAGRVLRRRSLPRSAGLRRRRPGRIGPPEPAGG